MSFGSSMHEDVVWVDNGKHVRTWKVFWIAYVHKLSTRTMYIFCQAFLHNGESGMLNWPWMCLIVLVVHAAQASKVKTCRFSTYPRNWLHRRSAQTIADSNANWTENGACLSLKWGPGMTIQWYTMIYIYIYVHNIYIYIYIILLDVVWLYVCICMGVFM